MNGDERREDRKEARQEKKADIKSGETRKEAREDKHQMKKEDRQTWKDEGHSIGDDTSKALLKSEVDVAKGLKDLTPMGW